jgi:hypothetical protein
LPAGDGRLLIAQGGGIDHLPNQWATFVRNLHVATLDGSPVASTLTGKEEGWTIGSHAAVDLTYDVSLDYAVGQWPAGNEQSGRHFPHALYTVTKPLFLYSSGLSLTPTCISRFQRHGKSPLRGTRWAPPVST